MQGSAGMSLAETCGRTSGAPNPEGIQVYFRWQPIRIDVYNEDNVGTVYDAEMQNLNNHSIEWHALPKRSRFYQASIDIDYMNKGNSYDSLPDSNIMFICTFDPFKKGLCQYTFRERCDEDHNTLLNEGTEKHFYNCCYEGEDIPDDLRKLYEYIRLGRAGNDLTRKIDSAVIEGRRNETLETFDVDSINLPEITEVPLEWDDVS